MLHSWQFAADGVWETALVAGAQVVDVDAVLRWIVDAPQNVAFEAVFAEKGECSGLIGLRLAGLAKRDQAKRIAALLGRGIRTEADFLKAEAELFPEFPLFSSPLVALNLGVLGQWFSVGPATLWRPGQAAPLDAASLARNAPRFLEPTGNPIAVEAWFTEPAEHWRKIYVSRRADGGYRIDANLYHEALERLGPQATESSPSR